MVDGHNNMMNTEDRIVGASCEEHPDALIVEDSSAGDLICTSCGLIVGDRMIDVGSEWRTFNDGAANAVNPSRVGNSENPLLNGSDLFTLIEGGQGAETAFHESGLNQYQRRSSRSNSERTLQNAFREIAQMVDRFHLPKSVQDKTSHIFKTIHDGKILRGHCISAIAAASLYIVCRQERVPRTFKEICAISEVSRKEIGRCFNLIQKAFPNPNMSVDPITTEDFMSRFCSNLSLPNYVQKAATSIASTASVDLDITSGRSPISVAAAAIYMASQASESEHKRSQKEIGEVAGVAEGTIRQIYKLLYPHAKDLFPNDFQFFTPLEQLPKT